MAYQRPQESSLWLYVLRLAGREFPFARLIITTSRNVRNSRSCPRFSACGREHGRDQGPSTNLSCRRFRGPVRSDSLRGRSPQDGAELEDPPGGLDSQQGNEDERNREERAVQQEDKQHEQEPVREHCEQPRVPAEQAKRIPVEAGPRQRRCGERSPE